MHRLDPKLLDLVLGYVRDRVSMSDVPLDHGASLDYLREQLVGLLREEPRDPAEVVGLYADRLAPTIISCDSPRYLAFIPAAPSKAALLFDMVVSAASLQGISWLEASGAIAAENQALRWIADLAGLPASAGGVFVTGGSAGNLSALAVARDVGHTRRGLHAGSTARVALSDQAHSSVRNTLHILGMTPFPVETDDHRLTGAALRRSLDADPEGAADVVAVVATAGTTNAGIVDDLDGVGRVAAEENLWLHVDGAYGGAGLLAPSVRARYAGIERADSFVVDPHKWLFAPFDCAALLYREPWLAKAVHTQDASYLDVIHHDDTEWNPSDYAYHLTRRARGLPLWFSLAVNGAAAYRDAVEAALSLTRRAADLIRAEPQLELIRDPELSVLLFRRIGWGPADYEAWSQRLLEAQLAFVTPSSWLGETVGRLVFLHPATTEAIVEDVLAATR
ncbi:MAG TPA: aminotransferase class I/II-fold pyridoxal phosphate-dependent enzyme [Actinomycetes bacterium]|nr:aminotransferase class I/II-fold pyridoxal phosphate-dependent enzyme [Actinomycetes bacterium]